MSSTPPPAYIPQTINTATQPPPHQTTQQPPWSPFPYPAYAPMSQPPTQQQQPFVPVTNGGFSIYSGRRNNKNNKNKRPNNTNNQNVTNMPNFTNMPYQPPYQAQPQMQQHYQFFNPTHQQQSQAQPQMQQRTFLNGNKNISNIAGVTALVHIMDISANVPNKVTYRGLHLQTGVVDATIFVHDNQGV